jgi:hypothetical protein
MKMSDSSTCSESLFLSKWMFYGTRTSSGCNDLSDSLFHSRSLSFLESLWTELIHQCLKKPSSEFSSHFSWDSNGCEHKSCSSSSHFIAGSAAVLSISIIYAIVEALFAEIVSNKSSSEGNEVYWFIYRYFAFTYNKLLFCIYFPSWEPPYSIDATSTQNSILDFSPVTVHQLLQSNQ